MTSQARINPSGTCGETNCAAKPEIWPKRQRYFAATIAGVDKSEGVGVGDNKSEGR